MGVGSIKQRERIDTLLVKRGLASSRSRALSLIMSGYVFVDGVRVDKAGTMVKEDSSISVNNPAQAYVSRGGVKLEAALREFKVNVRGKVALDVGASTGGFTDCLLRLGAMTVYTVDVGYGQLDWKLRQDRRVVVKERVNARYLRPEDIGEPVDIATIDVSFISLTKIIPAAAGLLKPGGTLVSLIKPQFEAGKQEVGKGGVVKDSQIHRRVLEDVLGAAIAAGFQVCGLTTSALRGPAGNVEFLAWFGYGRDDCRSVDIAQLVESVLPDSLSSR